MYLDHVFITIIMTEQNKTKNMRYQELNTILKDF